MGNFEHVHHTLMERKLRARRKKDERVWGGTQVWVFVIERVKSWGRMEMIRLVLESWNVPFEMGIGDKDE